jgi:hypothetical protein
MLSHYLVGVREMRGGREVQRVEDFSGAWRKARMGERATKGEEEIKRRNSVYMGVYNVVSEAREKSRDMGCEGKRDVERG